MANIQDLIEMARSYQMTSYESREQIQSFTYGNTHFENETITRVDVAEAVDAIQSQEKL